MSLCFDCDGPKAEREFERTSICVYLRATADEWLLAKSGPLIADILRNVSDKIERGEHYR